MGLDILSYLLGSQISSSGSGDLSDATATRADILYPKTAYLSNGRKNTGTIQSLSAATYTPSTTDQVIASGKYLAGDQTILGDPNLIADNIRKNISLFGVTGTYTGTTEPDETIRFIDYDGSVLYAYTPTEFANLSSLPSNPTHSGLTSQGWNWELSTAQAYVAKYGFLTIGQLYTPTSGATEIDITLTQPNLSPYLIITLSGASSVQIDWGDNSTPEIISVVGEQAIPHTYSSAGDYTIKLLGLSGSFTFTSDFATYAGILSYKNYPSPSAIYSFGITAVRLAENASIGIAAFSQFTSMRYITLPKGVTSIGQTALNNCTNLSCVILPDTVTELDTGAFRHCTALSQVSLNNGLIRIKGEAFDGDTSLQQIAIPETVIAIQALAFRGCSQLESISLLSNSLTAIGDSAFFDCRELEEATLTNGVTSLSASCFADCSRLETLVLPSGLQYIQNSAYENCVNLRVVTIPSTVTTIMAKAFFNCGTIYEIHFLPTTPPTITNSNAFTGLANNCIIYVPTGSLSAYGSATNYPSSSIYTYREE